MIPPNTICNCGSSFGRHSHVDVVSLAGERTGASAEKLSMKHYCPSRTERHYFDYGSQFSTAITPCPHDTDGDGNCGRRRCVYCNGDGTKSWLKTIALDFDGVIFPYSRGWDDGTLYEDPHEETVHAIKQLAREYRLVIYTCGNDPKRGIAHYMQTHFGLTVPITSEKPVASVYIDDRAVNFNGDWGQAVSLAEAIITKKK